MRAHPQRAGFWIQSVWRAIWLVLVLAASLPAPASANEIWLSGLPPSMQRWINPDATSDFMALFQQGAPWAKAASAVKVFKIYSQFANQASEAELRTTFADLRRRHIALALEAGLMTYQPTCGQNVEGYANRQIIMRIAERIRKAGGDVRYLAMDEPLWFGHMYQGPHACRTPLPELTRDIAENIALYRKFFPQVEVGDIEPFGSSEPAQWTDQIMQWAAAFKAATGQPLAFFDVDMNWNGPWATQLPGLAKSLRQANIKFGIIYNGDPSDQTGVGWTEKAERHFTEVEGLLGVVPDQAIFQTWMAEPAHMLPESKPGTLTWLVGRYLATATRVEVRREGGRLNGRLVTDTGAPLANRPIEIQAMMRGDPEAMANHELSGHVPRRAVSALFVLRINKECGCKGPAHVEIGTMEFRDTQSEQTVRRTFGPNVPVTFNATSGQVIARGTQGFRVVGGTPFRLNVQMATEAGSGNSGYVGLVFMNAKNKEISRVRVLFRPASTGLATVKTDAQGRFTFLPDPVTLRRSAGFTVLFPGTEHYRPARGRVN